MRSAYRLTGTFVYTDENGIASNQVQPLYEGFRVAEYEITGASTSVPVTVDVLQALFDPVVDLSVDLAAAPRGVVARIGAPSARTWRSRNTLRGADAAPPITIEVDPSVPEGTYPIVINGVSSSLRRAVTVDLVVQAEQRDLFLPLLQRTSTAQRATAGLSATGGEAANRDNSVHFLYLPLIR